MIKYIFAFILFIHGLIHLMGFAKAFGYGNMTELTKEISKPIGTIWLITAALFLVSFVFLLAKKESWPVVTLVAVVISQLLIISVWKDARFGTIANVVVLVGAILSWGSINFESQFRKDVNANLSRSNIVKTDLVTEADIQSLPQPVQKYLRYVGVLNKPKVKNVRIVFDGEMRDKGKDWFKFRSVQYNFFDEPTRLFFMKAKMFGVTVPGYHNYHAATASMDIRLFGLFAVVQMKGPEMNKAETVTVFNDMCIMAPATLIDKRFQWEAVDSTSAKATFTNGVNTISATLYFNESGQLVNFISDDRYAVSDMKQYRFSTPMKDYKSYGQIVAPAYGEAVWHYPDGEFVYGKFNMSNIQYNVTDFTP
ncbi:MAG: hypothetical protein K2U26_03660 [Cyclobacteriaceae bacterium]|nr:hypothetical protein [Cyclobacteriaceae bacterium]